tara:strand:- start:220 stop:615 length:396 start_codon:yes stop_codon:yes gene_type:complete
MNDFDRGTRKLFMAYIIGFVFCVTLTLGAFLSTILLSDNKHFGIAIIAVLAVLQLIVQLVFFFHLAEEERPRLNTISLLFMAMVVIIIGFGSLWIMSNLNYNMMPRDIDNYIQEEENIRPEKNHNSNGHHR